MVRPEIKKRRREMAAEAIRSKKARKKLEKVVLNKKLKVNRKNLLAELKQYQLQPEQLDLLHSTSDMQTKGLKRFMKDGIEPRSIKLNPMIEAEQCLDAALLYRRRRRGSRMKKVEISSSSSEDTDDISTDTEIYTPPKPKTEESDETQSTTIDIFTTSTSCNENKIVNLSESKRKQEIEVEDKSEVSSFREPAIYVEVVRDPGIEKSRLNLPIIGEEQSIMETIRYNDVVVVSGETGSGKTTQLPQFLYEAGYSLNGKLIGITEPRRVAAISMSQRVARELNLTPDEVSYQIRFSGNVTENTKIKFMTDGVLLRECQKDFLLSKYSVIIIDEAHERSVFSDILIGLLSRIVPMRSQRNNPLKLIIMSATLKVTDFTQNSYLFKKVPPIINIESRQFPVTLNFAKKTPSNYLQAAYRKVCSIHSKMPKGGILVFVTSQLDVKILCRKLREKFPREQVENDFKFSSGRKRKRIGQDLETQPALSESLNWSDTGSDSDSDDGTARFSESPLFCLGLYAMLPMDKQQRVFQEPPINSRLCVVATNVAETSLTIPNIRYVVDTGMEKTKVYDLATGASKFVTTWTSKSSADQRMGRAGRTGPGYCYRLYSSAVFTNDLPDHSEPRILQRPVEDIILQMKSMNFDNVVNFPFPTRPSIEALKEAEKKLISLGALDDSKYRNARFADMKKTEFASTLTPLGRAMSQFAVSARCSKMIVLSPTSLLPHVINLVSALTVREMFLDGNRWREIRKKWAGHGNCKLLGDFGLMMRGVRTADRFGCSPKLCTKYGLRTKAMLEIDRLRKQLIMQVNANLKRPVEARITEKPTESRSKMLRQLLSYSFCDHVARKIPNDTVIEVASKIDPCKKERKKLKNAYKCTQTDVPVYICPGSVLKGKHPECIIYKELYAGDNKTFMRDIAVVDPKWLSDRNVKPK